MPPSRKWYLLAVLIFLAGMGAMALFLNARLTALGNQLIQIVVPGATDLRLAAPGTYTIFVEQNSVVDGRLYVGGNVSDLRITVRAGDAAIPLTRVTGSSRYSFGGRSGLAVLEFAVAEPGIYRLSARYADDRTEPQVVLAIGRGFTGWLFTTIFAALAISFGGAAIALAIAIPVFLKRRRAAT